MAVTLTFDQALDILRGAVIESVRNDPRDLTQRQMAVILIVYLGEASRTVRELAAELGIGKPAITRALDKLEGLGLVKRLADVRDKRSIIVGRTVQGTVYLRELADRITKSAAASRR